MKFLHLLMLLALSLSLFSLSCKQDKKSFDDVNSEDGQEEDKGKEEGDDDDDDDGDKNEKDKKTKKTKSTDKDEIGLDEADQKRDDDDDDVDKTASGPSPKLPKAKSKCPTLKTGNVEILGHKVQLWVGEKSSKKAPILFYWHGTGSFPGEAQFMSGSVVKDVVSKGGMVASFVARDSTKKGRSTGNNVWYTGDFELADELLACANEQLNIDARRIYSGGCSAGGLQASAMVYERSQYLAGAMPNSGGTIFKYNMKSDGYVPALATTHGGKGDVVVINFGTTSMNQAKDIAGRGGNVINCNHGGGHCQPPGNVVAAQWDFLQKHPYGTKTSPYKKGLPSKYPDACKSIKK